MRLVSTIVLGGLILLAMSAASMACVGARPLSMGGAFIGLADDVNATYWNPAGIATLNKQEFTFMHTTTNRDEINYQDYIAYAGNAGGTAIGLSHIANDLRFTDGVDNQKWYWLSTASVMANNTYGGMNFRMIDDSLPGVTTGLGLDVSFLRKIDDNWSVGLLIQDINEPEMSVNGIPFAKHVANMRPGMAYRFNKDTVVTADIYDLLDNVEAFAFRFGAEKVFSGTFAVRAGYYGMGHGYSSFTFGGGVEVSNFQLDAGMMTGDLDNTMLLSATAKF